jgi:putative GTP pyrophosphokinase
MSEVDDNEAAHAAYTEKQPLYKKLAQEVRYILETKLEAAGLIPVAITDRPKDIESFAEKIKRKQYSKPLEEMTDLAGARVVCSYESDLAKVAEVIEANFDVLERVDKSRDLGVDRMGYNGKAFVVKLRAGTAGVRYEGITNLLCEIQVRTILQDAWAVIDHQLVYKNEKSIPERLRRDLNSVALLLEIAQKMFDSVKEKRAAYHSEIQQKEENPPAFLAQPLDFDTVIAYTRWKFPGREVNEALTQTLLRDINLKDYPTLQQLDTVVGRAHEAVDAYRKENPAVFKTGTDFLTKSLGFVDVNFRNKHRFAAKTRDAFGRFQNLLGK